jgi:hypothetical protein
MPSNPATCTKFSIYSPFLVLRAHYHHSGHRNYQASALVFAQDKPEQATAMSIVPGIGVSVDIEQHPAPQMSRHSPGIDTDDEVHEKPDGLCLPDNLEGDV